MAGAFTHVIHAAVDAVPRCRRSIASACSTPSSRARGARSSSPRRSGAGRPLTSSGGVYGRQPTELAHMPEEHRGADPIPADAAERGAEAKRAAETLCAVHRGRPAGDDNRAVFRIRGPVPAARRAPCGRQLHRRRACAAAPSVMTGDGTPYAFVHVRHGSRSLAVDDPSPGPAGASVQRRLRDAVTIADLAQLSRTLSHRRPRSGSSARRTRRAAAKPDVPDTARALGVSWGCRLRRRSKRVSHERLHGTGNRVRGTWRTLISRSVRARCVTPRRPPSCSGSSSR